MPLKNSELVSILKELIEVCKDGEQGYKDAADDVRDEEVQKILLKYSHQRSVFFAELEDASRKLGGDMEFSGSLLGILHRRWMDVKFAVAGSDTYSILKECIRGEKSAIVAYEKVIRRELPADLSGVVSGQYNEIKDALENLLKLQLTLGFAAG
jgi:uncharacterized protein (TIGR02284 family)